MIIEPTLWDQLGPGLSSLLGGIQKQMRPDDFARTRLQEMAQRDPSIMARIANMSP